MIRRSQTAAKDQFSTRINPLPFSSAALTAFKSKGAENSRLICSRKQGPECVAQDSPSSPAAFQDRSR